VKVNLLRYYPRFVWGIQVLVLGWCGPFVPSPRGGGIFWNLSFSPCSFLGVFEPETFPVGFDDVDAMVDAAGLVDAVLNSFEENALDPSGPVIVRVTGPSPGGKFRVNRKKEQHWRSSWMYSRNSLVYSFSIEMM